VKKYEAIFLINFTEKIIIPFEDALIKIDYCYEVPILLDMGLQKLILANVFIYYAMQKFSDVLKRVLKNELLFHESITKDIGYFYNEYSCNEPLHDREKFVEVNANGRSFWVGYEYYLWSSCLRDSSCATWIYNDVDGDIVFEVTPLYVACDPQEQNYVSYEEWIKNYKPFLIKKISKEVVQQWLDQANFIVEQIDNNVARWKQEEIGEME